MQAGRLVSKDVSLKNIVKSRTLGMNRGAAGKDASAAATVVSPLEAKVAKVREELPLLLVPPRVRESNEPKLLRAGPQMTAYPGIARTPPGRLWVCWGAGEDGPGGYFMMASSYFPISDRQQRWDMYVNGVGRIVRTYRGTPDRGHPPPYFYVWETGRMLDQFGVIFITEGQGEFESATCARTVVEAGTVCILFPGEWHRYRAGEKVCWSCFWVHVGGGYFQRLVERQVLSAERPIFQTGLQQGLLRADE